MACILSCPFHWVPHAESRVFCILFQFNIPPIYHPPSTPRTWSIIFNSSISLRSRTHHLSPVWATPPACIPTTSGFSFPGLFTCCSPCWNVLPPHFVTELTLKAPFILSGNIASFWKLYSLHPSLPIAANLHHSRNQWLFFLGQLSWFIIINLHELSSQTWMF